MRRTTGRSEAAEEELALALRTGPFHRALRTALTVRGLALHRVQHRLAQRGVHVAVASLSYWQQGARVPRRAESLRAVRALEDILQLPPQALTRLLAPAPAADGRPPVRSYRTLLEKSESVARLIAELDSPSSTGLRTLCHLERIRIGSRRELSVRESQHVVRAQRDGVDRFLVIHQGELGCEPRRMRIRATDDCRLGRSRWDTGAGVLVAELLFDTRLRTGDTHVFGFAVQDGTGGESTEWFKCFPCAGGHYTLQVRFDPGALPVRCRRFAQGPVGGARTSQGELTVSGQHRTVHLAEQDVRPGTLGIDWDWS
ncbi:hypothetical protein [Streptomyces sp. NPDC018031]|uniref:hypothetical protein n=1 Tax=Streptomyces sp. NPDC018031 TaxID=3365033 RepID=UPI0037A0A67C